MSRKDIITSKFNEIGRSVYESIGHPYRCGTLYQEAGQRRYYDRHNRLGEISILYAFAKK